MGTQQCDGQRALWLAVGPPAMQGHSEVTQRGACIKKWGNARGMGGGAYVFIIMISILINITVIISMIIIIM